MAQFKCNERIFFKDDKPTTISRAGKILADGEGVAIFATDRYKATVFPLTSEFCFAMISGAFLTIIIFNPPEKKALLEYRMKHS